MALGNNLKRIKRDNLIPEKKKGAPPKAKAKEKIESKSKANPKIKEALVAPSEQQEKIVQPPAKVELTKSANLVEKVLLGGKEDSPTSIKLIPSRRKSVRKTKLLLEGSLSLLEAKAIKECLLSTFKDYDLIDIQLVNVTHLDLIPIQLIKTFINYYPNKKIKVDSDLPFDIKIIVERAGFGSLMFNEKAA